MAGADEAELREVLREWEEKRNPVKLLSWKNEDWAEQGSSLKLSVIVTTMAIIYVTFLQKFWDFLIKAKKPNE